jgi:18S rRNA (adenine1779-N6/adenine1780-N6)-dimethyltransferase
VTNVSQAGLRPTDHVLEVGPGTGNLTIRILESAKHITAVEADPRMAAELTKRIQASPHSPSKVSLIIGDFTKATLPAHFDVCISNTPYQISSPLVFSLLSHAAQHQPPWRCAVLTFQREFALRLCAQPGTALWTRLSANVQLYAKVQHIAKIDKNSFRPPPKVESSIVKIEPIVPPPPVRFEEFDGMNRIIFSRANKTVRGNFGAKGVREMCEKNWRTWCSENNRVSGSAHLRRCQAHPLGRSSSIPKRTISREPWMPSL